MTNNKGNVFVLWSSIWLDNIQAVGPYITAHSYQTLKLAK